MVIFGFQPTRVGTHIHSWAQECNDGIFPRNSNSPSLPLPRPRTEYDQREKNRASWLRYDDLLLAGKTENQCAFSPLVLAVKVNPLQLNFPASLWLGGPSENHLQDSWKTLFFSEHFKCEEDCSALVCRTDYEVSLDTTTAHAGPGPGPEFGVWVHGHTLPNGLSDRVYQDT